MLWGSSATCGAAALATVLAAAFVQPDQAEPKPESPHPAGAADVARDSKLAIGDFAPVMDMDLRRPLVDQPPPPTAAVHSDDVPPAPPPPPSFRLAGTIIESGHCMALFTTSTGKTEVKQIGEEMEGAKLLSITDDAATLRWNGREIVVAVDRPAGAGRTTNVIEADRR